MFAKLCNQLVRPISFIDSCRYELSAPSDDPQLPDCMEGQACNFDVKDRLKCPFWAAGSFKRRDSEVGGRLPPFPASSHPMQ